MRIFHKQWSAKDFYEQTYFEYRTLPGESYYITKKDKTSKKRKTNIL